MKTREESLYWLNHLSSSNVLGSIFIVNQVFFPSKITIMYMRVCVCVDRDDNGFVLVQLDDNKINNLRFAFEHHANKTTDTSFVCISSKGEHICDELKSIGLSAINIFWDGLSTQSKKIEKLLISLDTLLRKSKTIESSSFICSEPSANKSECKCRSNEIFRRLNNNNHLKRHRSQLFFD